MAILLTKAGRVQLARSFHRDILTANDYYHFALGKTTPWEDEETPDTPLKSEKFIKEFRNNIIFTQAVSSDDICHLVRRIDWEPDTVFDSYDDAYSANMPAYWGATSLADAKFYVITGENKVYKCIDNNNNSLSTEMPRHETPDVGIPTSDGYLWKFMFQVSSSDENKFLDAEHIPVRKLTGNPQHDVNGEIDSVTVTNGGSGYTSVPNVIFNGDGDGTASGTAVVVDGVVTDVIVNEKGSGYSFANIVFTGGGEGSGATATVSLGDADTLPSLQKAVEDGAIPGGVDRIVIVNGGSDYSSDDVTVTITGDGTGAIASAEVSGGSVVGINVTERGSGYTNATVTITNSADNTTASARIILSPINGHGSNPIDELFSTTIGLNISLSDNFNSDLFLRNDFRQIGLVKNIIEYDSEPPAPWSQKTATACFIINVEDSSDYSADDIITTNDGGEFRVIQIIESSNEGTFDVFLQPIRPFISVDSILENTTKELSNLSINSDVDAPLLEPEIDVKTGSVVYIENRASINRAEDQVETIKALVNF